MKRTDRRTVFRHQLINRPAHSDVCALGYVVRGVEGSECWVGPLVGNLSALTRRSSVECSLARGRFARHPLRQPGPFF